jgi:predicted ATPase
MGEVYLGRDTVLGRFVALKVFPPSELGDPTRLRRFVEEARAASALNHPNIATIHELGDEAGVHFMVLEYVEGMTLSARITSGPFDPEELVRVGRQVAHALHAAHTAGIIHRDIKSSNIMIMPNGHVKVLDFGLAKRTSGDHAAANHSTWAATRTGLVVGTVPYMSPEQVLGRPLDHRSDLFSFGVVLYEMATGQRPFDGLTTFETLEQIVHESPRPVTSLNPRIPAPLEQLILRCLEKRAEDRIQTAAELADRLEYRHAGQVLGPKHNLPQQLTSFIGRQREMAQIRALWSQTRLVTLSGPGGIGKTRLALQIAAEVLREYEDGVWLIELAPLSEPALVPQTVAATLGIREYRHRSIQDALTEYLRHRRSLLVLDNCEHVIAAAAHLADTLLRTASDLRILTTSREALTIAGETVVRLSPLGLPDLDQVLDVEQLRRHEAVELFIDRARAAKSTFVLDDNTARSLATLCVQLEGLPLAIELAASRVTVLSVAQIAGRLHDRLGLLTSGSRVAAPRHQTLLAAIDWSYALLSEPEKALFRRLSVFAGGCTLEAAEAVCAGGAIERADVLGLMSALVNKSLVLAEDRDGRTRYQFMVTLLEYARKQLAGMMEQDTISRAHAEFVLALAVEAEARLAGTQEKIWIHRLEAEYDNIRAALGWTSRNDVTIGLQLAGALGRFWFLRGYWAEARRWLVDMLQAADPRAVQSSRLKVLNAIALIALGQGDYASARTFGVEALAVGRDAGDAQQTAAALNTLAILAIPRDDLDQARSCLEESLAIRQQSGDQGATAIAVNNLGILAGLQGDINTAESLFADSLRISKAGDSKHGIATATLNLGDIAMRRGDYVSARALLDEGLALARDLGETTLTPIALNSLGDLAGRQGDRPVARAVLAEALHLSRELGDKRVIADVLLSLGLVTDDGSAARALFAESHALHCELGSRRDIAEALSSLGGVAAREGDYATASSLYEESLALARQSRARNAIARALTGLADVARLRGDDASAIALYRQGIVLWHELQEKPQLLHPLEGLAGVFSATGQAERAVRLWGFAESSRLALKAPRGSVHTLDYDRLVDAARATLGDAWFESAWSQGRSMDLDQAIADALHEGPALPSTSA